ncbi:hypothetical protein AU476_19320 [Cupriavidus sp. UYMSc13B]|nr:hypothetical protein AU476_19320 [Cupriavidus sp. UYMSc13B]
MTPGMPNDVLAQPALWGAVGGLVVAVFNQAVTLFKEHVQRRRDQQRETQRSALLIAVSLETFAQACAVAIDRQTDEERESYGRGHEVSVNMDTMPQLILPADVDWRWIAPRLANDILGLRILVASSRHAVAQEYQPIAAGYSFAMSAEVKKQARRRGAEAWTLAGQLRLATGLPTTEVRPDEWDFLKHLRERTEPRYKRKRHGIDRRTSQTPESIKIHRRRCVYGPRGFLAGRRWTPAYVPPIPSEWGWAPVAILLLSGSLLLIWVAEGHLARHP